MTETVFLVTSRSMLRAFRNRDEARSWLQGNSLYTIENTILVDSRRHRLYNKCWSLWAKTFFQGYVYLSPIFSEKELADG